MIEFTGAPGCAAVALRDINMEADCHGTARHSRPLFANAAGQPYSYGTLNRLLHQLVAALFGEAVARTISWHSFRIWLAIALREANCPDALIQLICRWKCLESLQQYAQMGITRNAEWLRKAERSPVDVLRTANLPVLDNADALARLADPAATRAASPRRAQQAAAVAAPPPLPPPQLKAGDRIELKWGDRFFSGAFTSSRRGLDANGRPARLHRIYYDAADGWAAQSCWHNLDDEEWRRI